MSIKMYPHWQSYKGSNANMNRVVVRSFSKGVARLLGGFGSFGSSSLPKSGLQADYDTLASDWQAIGTDLETAVKKYAKQIDG